MVLSMRSIKSTGFAGNRWLACPGPTGAVFSSLAAKLSRTAQSAGCTDSTIRSSTTNATGLVSMRRRIGGPPVGLARYSSSPGWLMSVSVLPRARRRKTTKS